MREGKGPTEQGSQGDQGCETLHGIQRSPGNPSPSPTQHPFRAPSSSPGVNALLQLLPPSHHPFLPRKPPQVLTQLGGGQITLPGSRSVSSAGWDKAFQEKEPSLCRPQGRVLPGVADPARWLSSEESLVTPLDGCSAGSASLAVGLVGWELLALCTGRWLCLSEK